MLRLLLPFFIFATFLFSQTNNQVTLQLKWKNQFQFAGFLIAKEKGFYDELGLDVVIKEASNSTNPSHEVLSGNAHFAILDTQLIYERLEGKPLVALMSIYEKSPLVFLTKKSSGINSIQDFKYKKVEHPNLSSIGALQLMTLLKKNNIDYENVALEFGNLVDGLIDNKVDVVSAYATNQPYLLQEKGYEPQIIDPSKYGLDFYGDILFTSEKMIKENPDLVEKFYEASLKGWKFTYENLAQSVDIIFKKYNTQKKSKEALLYEAKSSIYYVGDMLNFGELNQEKIENIAKLMVKEYPNLSIEDNLDYFIYNNKLFLGNIDYEPLIFIEDDKAKGLIIDIVNEVIKETGIKANIKTMNWAKAQEKMNMGKADALLQININEERKKLYDFSYPLLTSNFHLFTQNNRIDIYDIESLANKTIGVEAKGYPISFLKKYPNIKIKIIPSWKDGFKLLENGKLDGIFVDKIIGDYTISKNNIKNISSKDIPLDTTYSHIAVKKGNKELLDKINEGLEKVSISGKKAEILNKWSFNNNPNIKIFTKEELSYIKSNTIKVTYPLVFEPLMMKDLNNNLIGIVPDFYELLSSKFGLKFDFQNADWNTTIEKLNNEEIDIIPAIAKSLAKNLGFYAAKPISNSSFNVYARSDFTKKIKSINDLKGLKIAYNSNIKILKKFLEEKNIGYELEPSNSILEALKKVNNKKVDVSIGFNRDAYFILDNELTNIKSIYTINEFPFESATAIKSSDKTLQSIMNKAMNNISYIERKNIIEKWIGDSLKFSLLSPSERIFLDKNKEFTVCSRFNHYPLSGAKDGKVVGIAGKVFERLSNELYVDFKAIPAYSDEEFISNVKQNRCDFISDISKDSDVFENIKTTNTSIVNEDFVAIGNFELPYLEDIEEKSDFIFYVSKVVHEKILKQNYPNLNVVLLQDEEIIMDNIFRNKKSVYVNLSILSDFAIQKYGVTKYKVVNTFETINASSSIGVNIQKVPEMLIIIDKVLGTFGKNTFYDISASYKLKNYTVNKNYNIYFVYGIILLIIVVFTSIYRNKLLKNQKEQVLKANEKLEALLELSTEGIFILDYEGKILKFSQEAMKNLGYNYEEMSKLNVYDWDKKLTKEELLNIIDVLDKKGKFTYTRTHTRKDGSEYIAQISAKIIEANNEKLLYSSVKDITQELEYQNLLTIERNKALASQADALKQKDMANYEKEKAMTALEEAKVSKEKAIASQEEMIVVQEELVQANKAKSEFLANMSHEIRTPLSGIIGITDIMLDEVKSPKVKENLTIIKNSSITLKNIINDVLDFSKIQSGKFQIVSREFSLKEILNDIEVLFKPQITSKGIAFKIEIDDGIHDYLIGDSLRINQILNNLIGNSVKFTHKGKIEVKVKKLYENDNVIRLEFMIKDTGIGIEEKVKEVIFDSFTQGELSNTKSYQGSGLGLAITKSLIDLMNGKINFVSAVGVGTSFYFNLEFEKIDKLHEEKTHVIYGDLLFSGKKALVVEDSEINQIVAKKTLTKMGFEIDLANDGEEGVDAVKNVNYDIVYMDIQMPNMDGFEATRLIRKFNKDIPIIALSAAVQEIDRKKSFESGMNDHLKKPIEKNELIEVTLKYIDTEKKFNIDEENENKVKESINKQSHSFANLYEEYGTELTINLLETYYTQYKDIENEINNLDDEKLDKYIHKLKGSSGSLKFNEIFELCILIREKNLDKELIKDLIEKIKVLLVDIEKVINQN